MLISCPRMERPMALLLRKAGTTICRECCEFRLTARCRGAQMTKLNLAVRSGSVPPIPAAAMATIFSTIASTNTSMGAVPETRSNFPQFVNHCVSSGYSIMENSQPSPNRIMSIPISTTEAPNSPFWTGIRPGSGTAITGIFPRILGALIIPTWFGSPEGPDIHQQKREGCNLRVS